MISILLEETEFNEFVSSEALRAVAMGKRFGC